jgi:hypothetical protein
MLKENQEDLEKEIININIEGKNNNISEEKINIYNSNNRSQCKLKFIIIYIKNYR